MKKPHFKATYTPPTAQPAASSPAPSFKSGSVSFTKSGQKVIKFYRAGNAYGCFSNFSRHPILLHDKQWPVRVLSF